MTKPELIVPGRASDKRQNVRALFTQSDYLSVRRAMDELPLIEKLAVEMRFFHSFSIEEIATALELAWDDTEALIESALVVLKERCLNDYDFSRAKNPTDWLDEVIDELLHRRAA